MKRVIKWWNYFDTQREILETRWLSAMLGTICVKLNLFIFSPTSEKTPICPFRYIIPLKEFDIKLHEIQLMRVKIDTY